MCSFRLSVHLILCLTHNLTVWFVQRSWLSVTSMIFFLLSRVSTPSTQASIAFFLGRTSTCRRVSRAWLSEWSPTAAVWMWWIEDIPGQHNLFYRSSPRDANSNWCGVLFMTKLTLCPTIVMKYYINEFFNFESGMVASLKEAKSGEQSCGRYE